MTTDWKDVERRLARWMRSFQTGDLRFTAGNQAVPGFPSDGMRADGALTDGKTLLALEVEAGQNHPDTNVGKYWLLADHYRYERVVLFHVYTPRFNSYGWRKTLGEFYARRMENALPFEYRLIDLREAKTTDEAIARVQEQMLPYLHAM